MFKPVVPILLNFVYNKNVSSWNIETKNLCIWLIRMLISAKSICFYSFMKTIKTFVRSGQTGVNFWKLCVCQCCSCYSKCLCKVTAPFLRMIAADSTDIYRVSCVLALSCFKPVHTHTAATLNQPSHTFSVISTIAPCKNCEFYTLWEMGTKKLFDIISEFKISPVVSSSLSDIKWAVLDRSRMQMSIFMM